MKKLWINENKYVLFNEAKKTSLLSEIATRKRSFDFYSILQNLPDPDPVLRKQDMDITVYREFLSDPHIWACIQSRKSGVLSLEWQLDKGKAKTKQAQAVENMLNALDLNTLISETLDCVFFGFQPLEIMWDYRNNLICPVEIKAKPPEWFVFDDENRLKLKTKENFRGELLPEKKFLCPQYNPSYQNPYGERTLSRIFWSAVLKKKGLQFWLTFVEKYGMPYLLGKHPRGTPQEENADLADLLEIMVQDAVAVIPDDSSVEILEAVRTSSVEAYEKLLDKMNAEISKAILGQTLTTEIGDTGSYAASNTHMGVRKDIIDADRRIVERTLNQLIRWIYEHNFPGQVDIPVFSMYEEEAIDLNIISQRDKTVSETTGIKFTKKYLMKTYGYEEDDFELPEAEEQTRSNKLQGETKEDTKQEPVFKEFKESEFPDQQAIDKFIGSFSNEELQTQAETILKPVFELINSASSYEEIYEKLTDKGLETDEIEKILQKVIFTSQTWGRLSLSYEDSTND